MSIKSLIFSRVSNSKNNTLQDFKERLMAGDVCVFPTDTVVGIGCVAYKPNDNSVNSKGIKRVFEIKNRDDSKKLPWLIGSYSWVERYATNLPFSLKPFADKHWPGGTTLIVAVNNKVDDLFCSNVDLSASTPNLKTKNKPMRTLALRVPNSDWLLDVLKDINVPIACTSANVSGQPAVANILDVSSQILDCADFVFNYTEDISGPAAQSVSPSGEPSKIFDCTSQDFKRLR